MSKKSKICVEKNSKIWKNNLTDFEKSTTKRHEIPNIEHSLKELCKIPKQIITIGRYNALAKLEKNKKKRCKIMSAELLDLWQKLNFPSITKSSVERKVEKLIASYLNFLKYRNGKSLLGTFDKIFDITNENGVWLSTEDRKLYLIWKNTNGKVGYTTSKTIEVHPSKACLVMKANNNTTSKEDDQHDLDSTTSTHEDQDLNAEYNEIFEPPARLKITKSSTAPGVAIVKNASVSTNKAAKICKELDKLGVKISTPSQQGIYKATIKEAERLEKEFKNTLKNESWCLHFDGKKFDDKEIQVIVLKNELREVKLAALVLDNGKSLTIYKGIKETLDKFDLWKSIKMIICDTTSVNTGNKNGIVFLLRKYFESLELPPPQYIGCQHHVLDLILRHVMDELLEGNSTSPNISYNVFTELIADYENLKKSYEHNNKQIEVKCIKWRDDMEYLFELGEVFRLYEKNNEFADIKFKAIPPLSNSRWNSRAILALLTFLLMPKYRDQLLPICTFICGAWYDIWFSDHCFRESSYEYLESSVKHYKKAHQCFLKHWVKEKSYIPNQQRSNICAERAIKVVKDIYPRCKTPRTLNLKFIYTNV